MSQRRRRSKNHVPASMVDERKFLRIVEREGRTIKWLAEKCDLSIGSLRHVIKGRRPLSYERFRLLLLALNARESDLVKTSSEKAS